MQSHSICAGPVLAALVSVSSYELCSADLQSLDLLVSYIPSSSHTSFFKGFLEPQKEGFDADIPFRAEYSKVSHSA